MLIIVRQWSYVRECCGLEINLRNTCVIIILSFFLYSLLHCDVWWNGIIPNGSDDPDQLEFALLNIFLINVCFYKYKKMILFMCT